ncbi:hypothetical protein [Streptomyces sp. enrichment culture]|uniref:hypothetical protein n=1 Tax=Streptomyces sp. enrichment culture TaxID=1795815 RepID=UPI003F5634C5
MTPKALDGLRAEASRDDYASMARLARALYETGLGPREVLRECYGVTFPPEVFVLVEGGLWRLELRARFTNQPWQPAVPPSLGGPSARVNSMRDTERRLLAEDPDLMPLCAVPAVAFDTPDQVVCYRLGELREGRSTVFALPRTAAARTAVRCGDSLLEVLYGEHVRAVRRLEAQRDSPSNWGAGSVDDEEVEEEYAALERVRELRRRADARQEDAGA